MPLPPTYPTTIQHTASIHTSSQQHEESGLFWQPKISSLQPRQCLSFFLLPTLIVFTSYLFNTFCTCLYKKCSFLSFFVFSFFWKMYVFCVFLFCENSFFLKSLVFVIFSMCTKCCFCPVSEKSIVFYKFIETLPYRPITLILTSTPVCRKSAGRGRCRGRQSVPH